MNRFSAASLAFALGFTPASAFAACQAQGGLVCGGAPSISSSGDLQVSRGGEFAPLEAGRSLRAGDRVLSGKNAATLSLGSSCSAPVKAGSLVTLSRSGPQTCARISQIDGAPGSSAGAGGVGAGGVGTAGAVIGVGGPIGAGVAIAATSSGGKKDGRVSAQ